MSDLQEITPAAGEKLELWACIICKRQYCCKLFYQTLLDILLFKITGSGKTLLFWDTQDNKWG